MQVTRRTLLGSAALSAVSVPRRSRAQARSIRVGVLNDQSGPYQNTSGMLSVAAVRQAVQDAGDLGFPVEVLIGDHQNKPDLGAALARQWIDREGVDMIIDVPTSSVALAVNTIMRAGNKVYVNTGSAAVDLTGAQCTPNTIHWSYDTSMLAKSSGGAIVRAGGTSWYFISADYVFGRQLQRDTTAIVTASGGTVLGTSVYPFPGTTDFSSLLLSAQASGAKVLGLANAGADTVNAVKQAAEFGLAGQMRVAALLTLINDVHGMGLQVAQGLFLTESFYWDMNDGTRAFAGKLRKAMPDKCPNMTTAADYAGTLHFLRAVKDMGVPAAKADGAAVVARMKAMPAEDDCFGKTVIREDGLALVPAYLFQVKAPAESKGAWDYYKLVATTPAAEAWTPLAQGGCPLVRQ